MFQRAFKRLKKRYRSQPDDFQSLLLSLQENPLQGVELTDGMRKVRLSIVSKGRGKRGGGRVIIRLTVHDTCLSFLYIYDKSDMPNVSEAFLDEIIMEMDWKACASAALPYLLCKRGIRKHFRC